MCIVVVFLGKNARIRIQCRYVYNHNKNWSLTTKVLILTRDGCLLIIIKKNFLNNNKKKIFKQLYSPVQRHTFWNSLRV